MKKWIYIIIFTGSALVLLALLIINYKFNNIKIKHYYLGEYKVWAHRGYHKDEKENSINSFKKAIEKRARGIELDLWYDNTISDFIVSHEYPYKIRNGKLVATGKLLTLNELLSNIADNVYIWLDFKNLSYMSRYDAEISGRHLLKILKGHNIQNKCIVESGNPINLSIFSSLGIFTCYGIEPKRHSGWFKYNINLLKWKLAFVLANISAVSMHHTLYNDNFVKDFPNIPIYLFTVNDPKEIIKYVNDNSVKIILSDKDYYEWK